MGLCARLPFGSHHWRTSTHPRRPHIARFIPSTSSSLTNHWWRKVPIGRTAVSWFSPGNASCRVHPGVGDPDAVADHGQYT